MLVNRNKTECEQINEKLAVFYDKESYVFLKENHAKGISLFESFLIQIINSRSLALAETKKLYEKTCALFKMHMYIDKSDSLFSLNTPSVLSKLITLADTLAEHYSADYILTHLYFDKNSQRPVSAIDVRFDEVVKQFLMLLNKLYQNKISTSLYEKILFDSRQPLVKQIFLKSSDDTIAYFMSWMTSLLIKKSDLVQLLTASVFEQLAQNPHVCYVHYVGPSMMSFKSKTVGTCISYFSLWLAQDDSYVDLFNFLELSHIGELFSKHLSTHDKRTYLRFIAPIFFNLLKNNLIDTESVNKLKQRQGFQQLVLDELLKISSLNEKKTLLEKALVPTHTIGLFFHSPSKWIFKDAIKATIEEQLNVVKLRVVEEKPNYGFRSSQFVPKEAETKKEIIREGSFYAP